MSIIEQNREYTRKNALAALQMLRIAIKTDNFFLVNSCLTIQIDSNLFLRDIINECDKNRRNIAGDFYDLSDCRRYEKFVKECQDFETIIRLP